MRVWRFPGRSEEATVRIGVKFASRRGNRHNETSLGFSAAFCNTRMFERGNFCFRLEQKIEKRIF